MAKIKETELAAKVVEWLRAQHWDVYQEVEPKRMHGGIADIVAVSGPMVWVIETKTSMSLALLEQAYMWRGFAHCISIAVPAARRTNKGSRVAGVFLKHAGIGLITYNPYRLGYGRPGYSGIRVHINPQINRKISPILKDSLNEHQKDYAQAGNANGLRWTPFNQTCRELQRFVENKPGVHLKAAIDGINHHYASDSTARACIARYLQMEGVVKGVRCEREGRYLRLYPKEQGVKT